ncbi:hypothetical protein TNCV_924841 [Trichonephila clavipes]|nr:hypothetical protein TNCV_924841 [Trichonephila clavipes]
MAQNTGIRCPGIAIPKRTCCLASTLLGLNPLEFFWGHLKSLLSETRGSTMEDLMACVWIVVASAGITSTPNLSECIRQSFILRYSCAVNYGVSISNNS